jgi:hypothetical protein
MVEIENSRLDLHCASKCRGKATYLLLLESVTHACCQEDSHMVPILWDYFMSRKESISLGFEDEKNLQEDFLPKFCTSAGLEPETS